MAIRQRSSRECIFEPGVRRKSSTWSCGCASSTNPARHVSSSPGSICRLPMSRRESLAALKEAQALITDLREQNDKMSKALADAQSTLNDPALKERFAKLEETNKQLNVTSSKVENSVASSIASNAPLVEKVQDAVDTNTMWVVVFSGDPTLDAAKYEVDTVAPKLGIPNASIYFRQGSYRGVSVVGSKSEAEQILPKAKQRRADAYIVNMSNWCPNSNEKSGYRECVSP